MGSADWMGRNLDRRVETTVPVLDPDVQDQIVAILDTLRQDNSKTRWLQSDGTYARRRASEGEPIVCAHDVLMGAVSAE
jgi:polyphosphate kinase